MINCAPLPNREPSFGIVSEWVHTGLCSGCHIQSKILNEMLVERITNIARLCKNSARYLTTTLFWSLMLEIFRRFSFHALDHVMLPKGNAIMSKLWNLKPPMSPPSPSCFRQLFSFFFFIVNEREHLLTTKKKQNRRGTRRQQ